MSKNLLTFFASAVLAFILGEVAVRSLKLVPPVGRLNVGHYQLSRDPQIRYEYKKRATPVTDKPTGNSKAFMRRIQVEPLNDIPKEDYRAFIRANLWDTFYTNSWGFRDHDWMRTKPKETVRIAVLGDSITSADNVKQKHRYTELVESCLNENDHSKTFEVMNFGVGGYNTLQEVATLQKKGLPFQPDIVVIAYCLNDNMPESDGSLYRLLREKGSLHGNKWMNAFQQNLQGRLFRLFEHSQLYVLLKYLWITKFAQKGYHRQNDPTARDIVTGAFSMLSDIRTDHDIRVFIVVFPYFTKMSEYPYKTLHLEVAQKAKQYDFYVLDLFDYYAAEAARDGEEFRATRNDICHPNELGHVIAAKAICETLGKRYPEIVKGGIIQNNKRFGEKSGGQHNNL
jgi:lysophospholipase L1-like esterase